MTRKKVEISRIVLFIVAVIGLITIANFFHELTHYIDARNHGDVVTSFCALGFLSQESDWFQGRFQNSSLGFITHEGKKDFKISELKAEIISLGIMSLFGILAFKGFFK